MNTSPPSSRISRHPRRGWELDKKMMMPIKKGKRNKETFFRVDYHRNPVWWSSWWLWSFNSGDTFSGLIITETPGTALSRSSFTFKALILNCLHWVLKNWIKKQVNKEASDKRKLQAELQKELFNTIQRLAWHIKITEGWTRLAEAFNQTRRLESILSDVQCQNKFVGNGFITKHNQSSVLSLKQKKTAYMTENTNSSLFWHVGWRMFHFAAICCNLRPCYWVQC